MFKLTFLLTFLTVLIINDFSCGEVNQKVIFSNGSAIVEESDIKIIRGLLTFRMDLTDIGNLSNVMTDLTRQLEVLNDYRNLRSNLNKKRETHQVSVLRRTNEKLNRIKNKVCYRWMSHNDTLHVNKRRKRGLLDIGGSVLKGLFGTATVSDLNKIDNKVNNNFKRHTVLLKNLHTSIDEMTKIMEKLDKRLYKLTATVLDIALHEEIDFRVQEISHVLDDINLFCNDLNFVLLNEANGVLNMFDLSSVKKHIESTKDSWSLLPMVELDLSKPQEFLNMMGVHIVNENDKMDLILEIPFVNRVSYKMFKFIPIPMLMHNSQNDKKYLVKINKNVLILSKDMRFYNLVDDTYLENCDYTVKNEKLCPTVLLRDINAMDKNLLPCELEILFEKNITNCVFRETERDAISIYEINNKLIVVGNPKEKLYVNCHVNFTYTDDLTLLFPETGILVVSKACSFYNHRVNFQATKINNIVSTSNVHFQSFENLYLQNVSSYVEDISLEKLRKANELFDKNIVLDDNVSQLYYYNHVQSISIVIALGLGILLLILFIVLFRKLRMKVGTNNHVVRTTRSGVAFDIPM